MKLGVLIDRLDPGRGGAEAHTFALVRRALACGEEVLVATLDGRAPDGVAAVGVRAPRRRPARDRVFAENGTQALRDAGCDVVLGFRHCPGVDVYLPHGGLVGDALHAQDAARGGSSGLRRLGRLLSLKTAYFLQAEEDLLGRAEGPTVIAVSRLVAARIAVAYPTAAARTVVVPNGVDAAHFDPAPAAEAGRSLRRCLGLEEDTYVGLLLAQRPRLKGARTALAALEHARVEALDRPFHLLVAGGDLERELLPLARAFEDRVHVLGPLADPRPAYAAADVLVHPTWHDPCSLACLEALAMGVPVITTPANGVHQMMGARGGIVLEAPGLPDALAVALAVLADPQLRRATSEDARLVARRFPLHASLDRVLDVCRAAANAQETN